MKRNLFPLVLTMLLSLILGVFLSADSQGWNNNSLTLRINESFSLKLSNESRYDELTFSNLYLRNWQGGLICILSKKVYLGAFYKRENSQKVDYTLHENRYTLEMGWKVRLDKKFDFDSRFRIEIRDYQYDKSKDHLRFRLRVRIRSKLVLGKLEVNPFIAIEFFTDTIVDEINRYRFYAGFVFPLGQNAGFVVNYIRQGTKDKDTLHILNTGIELKF